MTTPYKKPITLAVECAAGALSVAVIQGGEVNAEVIGATPQAKAEEITQAVARACSMARISPKDVDFLISSNGPGSHTGIRCGIAFFEGLSLGLSASVKLIPLSIAFADLAGTSEVVGTAIKIGRNEAAVELYRELTLLEQGTVELTTTGSIADKGIQSLSVDTWVVDPRIDRALFPTGARVLFPSESFATLLARFGENHPQWQGEMFRYLNTSFGK